MQTKVCVQPILPHGGDLGRLLHQTYPIYMQYMATTLGVQLCILCIRVVWNQVNSKTLDDGSRHQIDRNLNFCSFQTYRYALKRWLFSDVRITFYLRRFEGNAQFFQSHYLQFDTRKLQELFYPNFCDYCGAGGLNSCILRKCSMT